MVINYTTKKTSTVISAVVTALLLIFSVSSFGQTPVAVENSSSLSIASFDSSYVNNNSSSLETFNGGSNGALVIAMDNDLQANGSGYFNTYSYGLVVALLHADVPVKWAISSTKVKDGIDFSANAKKVAPSVGSTNNYDFKSGPIIVYPGYEDQALSVINTYNNNLSSSSKVKVYRLTSTTSIEIRHTLFHKPKVAILNNGSNQDIHENVFEDAGLESGTHYVTNLNASDINGTSCVTMVSEPHADDIDAQDVIAVRDFVTNGGNFFAQCAAIRHYEGEDTNQRLLTLNNLNAEDQASGSIFYDNPNDAVFQIQGAIKNEGGSIKNFRIWPSNLQSGTDTKRFAYFTSGSENDFKFYGGKAANINTVSGGNVFYLGGHKYEDDDADEINGRRLLLNTLLIPPSRPASCGLVIPEPDIALIKTEQFVDANADACANVGETVAYTFTVSNQGNVSLSNITLTDALVASFIFVSGDTNADSNLDVTETWTYSGVYSITQSDIDAGLVLNTATVQGEDFNSTVVTDISGATITDDNQTETTLCQNPAIALVKAGVFVDTNSDLCANVSEIINYEFTITNQGNVSLSSILLTDPLVTNAVYSSGDDGDSILQIGETWICNGSYAITQQDIDAGEVVNSASVIGTSPTAVVVSDISGDTITNNTPTVTDLCQAASLALVKVGTYDDGDCTSEVGDVITYAFSVTNTGNVTLTNVIVEDPLVTMLGGPIASLAPGAIDTASYTASYIITQQDIDAGVFSNQANATGTTPSGSDVTDLSGTSVDNDTPTDTPICQDPAIALIKDGTYDDGDCTSEVGDVIAYSFSVTNTGNVTLTNVIVADPLVTMLGGPIASLAPGAIDTASYTASYTITQQDIDAGVFSNQATATGTAPSGTSVTDVSGTSIDNDTPTDTPICQDPAIALIKDSTYDDGDCTSEVGDVIAYSFSVTNTGNVTLTNVIVADPLVTMVGGPIASLAPGAIDTASYTASYTITQQDIDAGVFSNQATATGTTPSGSDVTDLSGTSVDNDTPTDTTICQDASIALIKVGAYDDGNCTSEVGDVITYTFSVTNTGNVTLTNVVVADPLVTMLGGPIASLAPGAIDTASYTASYIITQQDIDAGVFSNQATATGTAPDATIVTDLSDDTSNLENDPTDTLICNTPSVALVKLGTYDGSNTTGSQSPPACDLTINLIINDWIPQPARVISSGEVLCITETGTYYGTITVDAGGHVIVCGNATIFGAVTVNPGGNYWRTETTGFIGSLKMFGNEFITDASCGGSDDECLSEVGDTIDYAFTVTNTGSVTLTDVVVTDPLVTVSGGPIASLAPGASDSSSYTASYAITQQDIDAGLFVNQATVTATPPMGANVTDLSDDTSILENDPTVTILCGTPSIALVKVGMYDGFNVDGECISAVGDTINYTFSVTNTGSVTLTNVVVEDPLVTINGAPIASLAPGVTDSTTFIASYVITQQDIDAGLFSNQATATGTAPDTTIVTDLSGTTISNNTPTVTDICQNYAIAITKAGVFNDVDTSGCSTASLDTVTYTFTVTNQGNTSLTSVTVTDPLLGGLLTAVPTGDTNNNTILEVTETWVYVQDYVVTQGDIDTGSITNQATASGTGVSGLVTDLSGTTISDDIPTVTIVPASCFDAIAITKSGVFNDVDTNGCSTASVDTVTYTFTVTNEGNTPLTSVTVTDPLLGGLLTAVPSGDTNNNTILEVTETWVYVQDYVVTQSDIDTGSITNQATASGTGVSGLVTDLSGATISDDTPTVTTLPASCFDAIAITKAGVFNDVDTNGCSTASVDTVMYTFTITNQGNTPLTSVTVTDPLLGGLLTATPTGDTNNNTILEVIETWVYVQDYVVTQGDIDTGSITNQATASGTGVSGLVTDLSGTTISDDIPTVTIVPASCFDAIAITKSGVFNDVDTNGCSTASVDTVTYTFTVTNQGNTPLTSVTVTDPLLGGLLTAVPTGDTNNNTILEVTETWVYVQDYVVTQGDIDTGSITNQATASGTGVSGLVTDLSGATISDDIPTVTIVPASCFDAIAITKTGVFNDVDTNGCSTASVDTVTYTFTVTNEGNTPLTSVTVTDPLLGGLLTAVPSGDTNNNTILEVTETWVYVQDYVVTQSDIDTGSITNQATASGTGVSGLVTDLSGATISDDTPTVTTLPASCFDAIAITKAGVFNDVDTNGCSTASVDTVMYTFTITNQGNTPLTSVTVTDPLLGGLLTATPTGDTNNNTILEVTETWVYVQDYVVTQSDIDTGSITNQATASGTGVSGLVTDLSGTTISDDIPTVTIVPASCFDAIAITKSGVFNDVDTNGCSTASVDTVTYTFTVTNQGNTPLTSVTVTDPLLGGLLTAIPTGDTNNNTILEVTETWVYVQDYVVTQGDIDTGSITNQATASGTGVSGLVTDLSGTTISDDIPTVTIVPASCFDAIAITKSGVFNDVDTNGCSTASVDTVTYTFTVTNQGNTPLTSVTVTDPLLGGLLTATPTGDTNNNTILEVTETWVYVQDYVVTQSDIDTGSITNQATASGTGVSGLVTDLSGTTISDDIPTVTIVPASCFDAIAITKSGVFNDVDTNGCSTASVDTVTYTFTVTNQGNTPLTSVTVTDPLLGGLLTAIPTGDTNGDTILDISETWVYVQDYVVTQGDIDTGSITNQATASGTGVSGLVTDLSGATISDDIPTVTIIPASCFDAIAITKTGVFNDVDTNGCSTASVDTVTYTFTVTNQGNTPLTSVTVTDPLLGGLLTAIPTGDTNGDTILDISETWVYVQDYVVTQGDIDTGSITNQATASGTGVNGIVTDDDTAVTTIPASCFDAIAITKTGVFNDVDTNGCSTASVDTVTYTFTVTNQGNTPLTSVTVTDPLLGGLLTAIPTGDTNNNTILEVTETWVYVQDYVVTQSDIDTGSITNQATASGTGVNGIVTDLSGATVSDDIPTVTIIPASCFDAIAITKAGVFNDVDTSGCSTASLDTVTYTFTVTNQGNTSLTSVTVTDPLLGGLLTAVPTGDTNNNTILEVTETWVYVQDYVVTQSDIDTGSITNQATASGTGVNAVVTDLSGTTISDDIPTVTIVPASCFDAIAITKSGVFNDVDTNGCSTASVDTVTYTFTVTNQGNTPLTSVTVTDPLLGGLLTATPTGDTNGDTILDITETWVYVQDYVVTQGDIDTGSITNQATASGTGVNAVVTDLSGATVSDDIPTVTIIPEACIDAIAITKAGVFNDVDTSGCSTATVDTVTYTFTVTNAGNTPLTSVTVTDPLLGGLLTAVPSGDTNNNTILEVTETWVYVQAYVVTQLDIDTGSITNQATASGTGVSGLVTDLSGATISDDIPTVTIIPASCFDAIAITKAGVFNDVDTNGCSTASVDTVMYTFTITNQGNTPLTSVTVTDPLLGGLLTATPTGDTNNNTILEVTETWVYVQDYVVTQSDIDTGSITNQATASGTGVSGIVSDVSGATVSDDIPTVTTLPASCIDAIAITKTGVFNDVDTNGCSTASVDTVTYTFTVTNQGNTPLTSVTVTDPLLGGLLTAVPTGDTNNNTILEVTETWVYVQDYVVTQSDIDTGSITNQATASGTGVNGIVTDDDTAVTTLPASCFDAIAITKAGVFNDVDANGCTSLGVDTVTYTFTVTNQGNTSLTSVTVTDPLLGGLLTATPTGDTNNNTILDITETWVFVQDYVVTQSDIDTGSITNQATASGTGVSGLVTDLSGATISDDIPTVTIVPEACFDAIAITKAGVFNDVDTSGCSTASVDTVTYTFTVTNQGNTSLTGVTVTDPLLGGLLTATPTGDTNNNTILEVTETWVYVQDYVVTQGDIDTGSITNQATASGTGVNGIVTDDDTAVTTIPASCFDAIAITKSGVFNDVDTNGCSTASVDTVMYTFTITNQGNTPLTSVTVTDPLLGGLLTATPTGDANNNTILEVTETWVYVQDYVVTQSDIDTGSITNQATASGTGVNGIVSDVSGATISDDIPTVTTIPASCFDAIAITKAGVFNDVDTNGCTNLGVDTVTYTFTVTNQGNTPLTSVTVTDPLLGGLLTAIPTGDTNGDTILDITETWVYVQDYVVTQSDIDTGSITNQATASGTGVSGLVTDLSGATISDDIPTVTIVPEACLDAIAITKTGVFNDVDTSGCSTASVDTVTYTFTVTNQGNTPLTSVTVTDPLLGGLLTATPSGDTNNNTILEVTETWVYVQDYVVTQSDIDTGSITNQATASGTGVSGLVTDLSGTTISDDIPTVTIIPASCFDAIAITKAGVFNDVDANGCTSLGVDTVTYTFTVTNQGNTPLTSVTVTDPLLGGLLTATPTGDANNNTILEVTETWVYVQDYVVTQSDIDTGSITNQATASGTGVNGLVTDLSGATISDDIPTVTIVPEACLDAIAITKSGVFNDVDTSGCSTASVDTVTYTFTVTNQGNTPLTSVTVTDPLLGGLLTATPSGDTNGDTILDITETWVYVQDYVATQSDIDTGSITNQATASGTGVSGLVTDLSGATVSDDIPTVTIIPASCFDAIAITKAGVFNDVDTSGCSTASVDTVTYTFTVTNQGNTPLTSVTVTDPLLGGLLTATPTGDANNNTILEVTETWVYVQDYVVTQSDIDTGSITNQATASGTGVNGIVTDDDTAVTTIPASCFDAIAITKTGVFNDVDTNGCSTASVDTVTYTFTVTNQGNTPLTGVTVTDPLLGGLLTAVPTGDANNNTILEVTETWVYVQDYVVTQSDIDTGSITNQATASGTGVSGLVTDLSGTTISDDIPTVTTLCQNNAIALIKTGVFNDTNADNCADVNETITYSFVVKNTGNTTISNIDIEDAMVNVLGGPITLAPGEEDAATFTAVYLITQVDIDLGSITNTAIVSGLNPAGVLITDTSDDDSFLQDDPTVTTLCQNNAIALIKTGVFNDTNADNCADVNETITYSFVVKNTGNTTISNIDIEDAMVNVIGGPITLAPGEEDAATFTAVYLITQVDIDLGSITNTAIVSGLNPAGVLITDTSDDDSFLQDDPTVTTLCQNNAIALIKTGVFNDTNADNCANVKETITYSFMVKNMGNTTISGVDIEDAMVNVLGGPITLAPGQEDSASFTAVYLITQADIDTGAVTNTATVTGVTSAGVVVSDLSDDDTLTQDDPTITPLCNLAVIALIKTAILGDENGDGCIDLGETIIYDFVVTNLGNVPLTQVIVTDPMVTVQGGPVTILAGESDTESFFAIYTVTQDDVENGQISNQAIAEGLDPSGNVVNDLSDDNSNFENDSTISILCQDPSIFLEKEGVFNDENNSGFADVGETISYYFTVTNTGNLILFTITVEDPLPGLVVQGGPIASLNPGQIDATTFTATYVITQADIDLQRVVNQATVRSVTANNIAVIDTSDDPTNLTNSDPDSDGDPDDPTITPLPSVGGQFEIFNAVSADENGENDFFFVSGISDWPDNNVQIFNRWGVKVFETSGYGGSNDQENVFRGYSDGRQTVAPETLLPTGTYYYIITFNGPDNPGKNSYAGYLYLNR